MPALNVVHLIGNAVRDPELRVTPRGTPICQLGLAINRSFKDESGQTKEEVTFVDIEAFGKQADTLAKYVKKGRPLYVSGRLRLDQWEDKASGQKRSRMKVVLENFQFLGGRSEGGDAAEPAPKAAGGGSGGFNPDADVPFARMEVICQ